MPKISIVNYGVGNLRSVRRGFEKSGAQVEVVSKPAEMAKSDAIVLPGVGAFEEAIANLKPMSNAIVDEVRKGKLLLGICLGLQLLFTRSYEGGVQRGLDLVRGEVVKLPGTVKLPHIGWNDIRIVKATPLLERVRSGSYLYFVHSYVADPIDQSTIAASTEYGIEFPSALWSGNIFATQFHPEKSGETGLSILRNFVETVKR